MINISFWIKELLRIIINLKITKNIYIQLKYSKINQYLFIRIINESTAKYQEDCYWIRKNGAKKVLLWIIDLR